MSLTDAQKIIELRRQLTEHAFRYYISNTPVISDQEYDSLFRELLELEKLHPEMNDPNSPTMRVGSPVPTSLQTVKHKVRMLSLNNLENMKDTLLFFDKFLDHEVTIEMKIDGLSLHLRYEKGKLVRAVTRGDGSEGEDVTENARAVRTIPLELLKPVDIEVRGEVFWRISSFVAYNESVGEADRYANPRNGASGVMRQRDSREVSKCRLDFVAYGVPTDLPPAIETQEGLLAYLESLGFNSTMTLDSTRDMAGLPYVTTIVKAEELQAAIEFLDEHRQALDLDTDGLVIKLSSLAQQRDVGEGERSPKWAAAYKFPPEAKETKLLAVTVQVGKTGQVTPVAQLEPVALGGTVVQRASLCNQDELNRLGIDIGDYVWVQRSGEVIPKVISLARPSPTKQNVNKSFQLPKNCPCCKTPLVRQEGKVHLYCPNTDCHDQVFARLVFSTGKDGLDINGCGEVGVQTFMAKANVRRLSDLFALKDLSFFKPAQRKKVQESLERAKIAPLWRKIAALNIEGIGKVSAQDLAVKYENVAGMYHDPEGTKKVIGEVATASLRQWVEENLDELDRLADLGFHFHQDRKMTGPLSGMSFCITGKLISGPRDDISALIESKGGVVKGTVNRKCMYLVAGYGGGQNKRTGAEKWGTRIITEEELYSLAGLPMPTAPTSYNPSDEP